MSNKITRTSELEQVLVSKLPVTYRNLVHKAREACQNSYSPYSNFAVGAAVLLSNKSIIQGANQENAAYPSGLCAERVALFYAGASHPRETIKAIAVTVANPIGHFPFPCGSCLQVMSEYQYKQGSEVDVIMVHPSSDEVLIAKGIENLLPFAFNKNHLKGL